MRPVNLSGAIAPSNPLYGVIDLSDSAHDSIGAFHVPVWRLAVDLMGDERAAQRNPVALSVLHTALMSVVPALASFSPAACGEDVRVDGAIDFIWAHGTDADNHAIEALGKNADRREPLAYAHMIAGYYRAMVEHMRAEMSSAGTVMQ